MQVSRRRGGGGIKYTVGNRNRTMTMMHELPSLTLPGATIDILKARCATCSMHQLCLPMGLDMGDMDKLDKIIGRRRRVQKGENLFRIGEPFTNLYAIRLGHFKTYQINANGEEQVTGFQMGGELLGMDAISTDKHYCSAMALEDSEAEPLDQRSRTRRAGMLLAAGVLAVSGPLAFATSSVGSEPRSASRLM